MIDAIGSAIGQPIAVAVVVGVCMFCLAALIEGAQKAERQRRLAADSIALGLHACAPKR
jgi:hypothetical protein